jgi:hypothetical protein
MDPLSDVRQLLRQYVSHSVDLPTLVDQLSGLAISKSNDSEARSLAGLAWRLVSEHDSGHRSETSIRDTLRLALQDVPDATKA